MSKIPCIMLDSFDFAPALTLAELRTITDVTGRPPNMPDTILPTPCAFNSLLVGLMRFCGSILSTASMLSKVSRLATMASVMAVIQTCALVMPAKLGEGNAATKSVGLSNTSSFTK